MAGGWPRPDPGPTGRGALSRLRSLRRWWRGVTGDDAYEVYVGHLRRNHPDQTPPTQAEFWREKYDAMERNPSTRCC